MLSFLFFNKVKVSREILTFIYLSNEYGWARGRTGNIFPADNRMFLWDSRGNEHWNRERETAGPGLPWDREWNIS